MGLEKDVFIDAQSANSFLCAICSQIAYPAVLFPCTNQHIFCAACVDRMETKQCPHDGECLTDRQILSISTVPFAMRSYNNLHLRCPQSSCEWTGTLRDLQNHADFDCVEAGIPCPHEGCDYMCPRREINAMPTHALSCAHALVACPYCNVGIKHLALSAHVDCICPLAPVPCPNNNASGECEPVIRSQLYTHMRETCPHRMVSCAYSDFGCKHTCAFKLMYEHNCDPAVIQMHLSLAHNKILVLSNIVNNITHNQHDEYKTEEESLRGSVGVLISQHNDMRKNHEEHISIVIQQQKLIHDNSVKTEELSRRVVSLTDEMRAMKLRREDPAYYIQALFVFLVVAVVIYGHYGN